MNYIIIIFNVLSVQWINFFPAMGGIEHIHNELQYVRLMQLSEYYLEFGILDFFRIRTMVD